MRELRRILVFVALENEVHGVQLDLQTDLKSLSVVGGALALAAAPRLPPDPETYVLIEWESLNVLPPTLKIADMPSPGIVMALPDMPSTLAATALSLKSWIEQGTMRRAVEEHLGTQPFSVMTRSGPVRFGSRERPFESPQALLSFLESSHPELFVFRGQVQAYDGQLLPSALRGRVKPITVSGEGPPLSLGSVTLSGKEIGQARWEEVLVHSESLGHGVMSRSTGDGLTGWDVPEAAYRNALSLETPYETAKANKGAADTCVAALIMLFGDSLAMILSQQYGLTSTYLDVTTKPKVALFFATHASPYYGPVGQKEHLGVVYRWAREGALVAEDHLTPLEGPGFQGVRQTFRRFVNESPGLEALPDDTTLLFDDGKVRTKLMAIRVHGPEKSPTSLVFPTGTFELSRIGRQGGAFLKPRSSNIVDGQVLLGDLMKMHHCEAFYFRHTKELPHLGRIDKFYLWPAHEPSAFPLQFTANQTTAISFENLVLQDLYLELLLGLFSPWSPVQLALCHPIGNEWSGYFYPLRTVVDPGFAIHPRDAGTIARRLLEPRAGGTVVEKQSRDAYGNLLVGSISPPVLIFIPSSGKDEFYRSLIASVRGR